MNEFTYSDNYKDCPRLSVVEQYFNGHRAELQEVPIPTTEDLEELRSFAVETPGHRVTWMITYAF